MIKVFLLAIIIIIAATMMGIIVHDKLKLKSDKFVTPIGFATLIFVLQILYYPAQMLNLPSVYVHICSLVIISSLLIIAIFKFKEVLKIFNNKATLWILISVVLFVVVFYHVSLTLEFSDGQMYLGYIASNIQTDSLNNFNLWTGEVGKEWDSIYLFQGYYPFVSSLCFIINIFHNMFGVGGFVENIVTAVWVPGIIYSVISSMAIYNIVDHFKWNNKAIKYSVLALCLFLLNFYYYRVAFAYYGNTFRTLYITVLLYILYRMISEKTKQYMWIAVIIIGAGIAFSSSFLFISFSMMYCLLVYFLLTKEENIIRKMSIIVSPIVVYALAKFVKDGLSVAYVLMIIVVLYYLTMNFEVMKKIYRKIEEFFIKHAFKIFIIMIPLIGIGYSIWLYFSDPGYPYNFFHYFQNHKNYDMVKDYFFIYSDIIDIILNILRWLGVGILIFKKPENDGINFIRWIFIITLITFLNPLSTSFISDLIASNVYYRTFELLFNPFTECLLLYLIFRNIINNNIKRILSVTGLILLTLSYHVLSYLNIGDSGYGFYLEEGKYVENIYKMFPEDFEVLQTFRAYVKEDYQDDSQMVVISHADGFRTMIPEAHQLFTARQYWYPWDRVNQEFYEMSRRHYSWQEPVDIDYTSACKYIEEFSVEYAIIRYYENWEYDNATSECMDTIYEFAEYKIKKVK